MKFVVASLALVLVHSIACTAQGASSAPEVKKPIAADAVASVPASADRDLTSRPAETLAGVYKIGPGDLLNITVWKETALTGPFLVRPDGMISVPLLGDVQASSATPSQLAGDLEGRLKRFIQSPNVTVQISQVHSKVIYLLGEVTRKGPIDMAPDMTLLQAISSAGGLTDYANTKKIYILRNDLGKQVKIPANYKEALKGNSSFNLALQPGDTIVVP
jgi:polysaccharide biosynthesis/export protein